MLFGKKMTEIVHELFEIFVKEGDTAIDATMGNGHDTLKLCQCVGDRGKVYSFDIQTQALENTKALLGKNKMEHRAQLICESHDKVGVYVQCPVSAFVFNLGYLPDGDPSIITQKETTKQALIQCLDLLKVGGLGIVLAYYGHEGGLEEKNLVDKLLMELPAKKYDVLTLKNHNRAHTPPILYMIKKKKL